MFWSEVKIESLGSEAAAVPQLSKPEEGLVLS